MECQVLLWIQAENDRAATSEMQAVEESMFRTAAEDGDAPQREKDGNLSRFPVIPTGNTYLLRTGVCTCLEGEMRMRPK